jgi:uncharacterized protein YndB with AHSA1/START domain/uncharacterized protein YciI
MVRMSIAVVATLAVAFAAWGQAGEVDAPPPSERITLPDGSRALRVSRLVDAPASEVYEAWASSEGFEKALGRPAIIEPEPGGRYEVHWIPEAPEGERGSEGCEVLATLPGRMISFTWNAPPAFGELRDERTRVVVEVADVAPGLSRMTLTHLGWPEGGAFQEGQWRQAHDYFANAWPFVCQLVVSYFERPGEEARYRSAWCYLITDWSREDLMETMTPEEAATLREHFQYLLELTREGTVVLAGPCTDLDSPDRGPGIIVFYADSEDAAREIMENDPAVKAGIFKARLHPMAMSLVRERDHVGG